MSLAVHSSVTNLDPLIGRDIDLRVVLDRLESGRLVTITGPGGSGKTRLAEEVVARWNNGGEAWFVDASSIRAADLLPVAIATSLRIESQAPRGPLEAVRGELADRDGLLAIDNVEQIDGAGPIVVELLGSLPRLKALVTSRIRMDVRGEAEVALQTLGLPTESTAESIAASPAGELFVSRARAAGRIDTLDEAMAADVFKLIHRLDGLPLAIELAAARTRVLTPAEILDRLDRQGVGAIDAADADSHRSLNGIIEWSRGLLREPEVRLLESVAVSAGFDVGMAEALAPGVDVVSALDMLIAVGLVQHAGSVDGVSRFRLLETVRSSVLDSVASPDLESLRDRHAHATATMIESLTVRADADPLGTRERLDAEADNIRLALDRYDLLDPSRGLDLWNRLFYPFWAVRARFREGMVRFERSAALVVEPTPALARAMIRYGMNQGWVGDEATSRAAIERGLEIARTVGDRDSEIEALVTLGAIAANQGDRDLATSLEENLRNVDASDATAFVRMRLAEGGHHVATVLHGQDSDDARDFLIEALAQAREADIPRTTAALWGNLAIAYIHRREFGPAAEASEETVALARQVESPLLPWALAVRAMALAELGQVEPAVESLTEMIAEALSRDMALATLDTLLAVMPVALAAGRPLEAARAWGAATALEESGAADIPPDDRDLAERTLQRVRSRLPAIDVELAIRDGAALEPLGFLAALPELLRADRPSGTGRHLRHGDLTRREVEILELLAAGRSDAEIAAELFISPKTASVHVSNVKAKLGVESRLEAALKAARWGSAAGLRPSARIEAIA